MLEVALLVIDPFGDLKRLVTYRQFIAELKLTDNTCQYLTGR